VILSDLKPKKKKKKRRKSNPPPKPRSAIDVARNPQPYQFNMYTPPFPAVINHQPKANANSQNVSNTFRNIRAVNAKELERLRGDLTAYRQESQTIFKKLVAFPREKVYYEPVPAVTEPEDETKEVVGDLLSEMVTAVEDKEAMDTEDETKEVVGDLLSEMVTAVEDKEAMDAEDETKSVVGDLLSEMVTAVEDKEAMDTEVIDDEEIRMTKEAIAPVIKKRTRITVKKTRTQLREELENLPGNKAYIMLNTQFKNTTATQMRELATARGINIKL